MAIEWIGYM